MSLSVFISYSHEDEALLRELENHLAMLRNQGIITTWNDREISAGTEWEREIELYLNTSQIILLLVSANFLASPYCYSIEMKRAIERHNAGEVRVIPIILRSADWKNAPFGKLQALPRNGKPIAGRRGRYGRDQAFLEVIFGIREAIETMKETPPLNRLTPSAPVVSTTLAGSPVQVVWDRSTRTALPASSTSLIGREGDIAQVRDLLRQSDVRLLTLLGPAGVGKTRLGLAVAHALVDEFVDGVCFVSLAALRDSALVPSAIAQALDLAEPSLRIPSQELVSSKSLLKAFVRHKHLLLVLDNFEQILEAAEFVGDLLEAAPHLKVLVTSRAILQLYGEYEFGVSALDAGDPTKVSDPTLLAQFPAIRLFVERAHAVNPRLRLTKQNASAVEQLCQRLDGLPLAIELAAARCRLLSPQDILKRLGGHKPTGLGSEASTALTFLHQEARNVPERQQTLLSTLDWSYHLLDPAMQRLFAHLGVFLGGWTLEAAQVIITPANDQASTHELLDQLTGLVSQSLVVPPLLDENEESEQKSPRFHYLETIREYAFSHLQESGERLDIQERHAHYYLALIEQLDPAQVLFGIEQYSVIQLVAQEQDNLRVALQWAVDREEAELAQRLCSALSVFWIRQSQFQEAHRWIEPVRGMGEHTPLQVRAGLALMAGYLAMWEGAKEHARALVTEALTLYDTCGYTRGRASALHWIGDTWYLQGEYSQAASYYEANLELYQELEDHLGYAWTLMRLGAIDLFQGNLSRAQERLSASLALFRAAEPVEGQYSVLLHLSFLAGVQGNISQALSLIRETMLLVIEVKRQADIGFMFAIKPGAHVGFTLATLGTLLGVAGAPEVAAQVCAAAEALLEQLGTPVPDPYRVLYTAYLLRIKAQIDATIWMENWTRGSTLTLEEAVALALEGYEQVWPHLQQASDQQQ